jgi:hypothetical protein
MKWVRFFILLFGIFFHFALGASARIYQWRYGVQQFSDSAKMLIEQRSAAYADSLLSAHPMLASGNFVPGGAHSRFFSNRSYDFYLILGLFLFLGLIRYFDSKYFSNLWKAFVNPTLSNRQLREQLQYAGISNLIMNLFFTIASGVYMYYTIKLYLPKRSSTFDPGAFLLMLVGGIFIIYLAKYAAVSFSGWAFKVENLTEQYLFNVFLINKVMALFLLPITIVIAFQGGSWSLWAGTLSFILIGSLFIYRYVRSWQVFGSFFEFSKFHFFTYLCASELLPMAVLIKLMVKGLLNY